MTFFGINPLWSLTILLPLIFLISWLNYRSSLPTIIRLGGPWRSEELHLVYAVKKFFLTLTLSGFLFFSLFSLTGMNWGEMRRVEKRTGLDLVIAVDISRSMLTEDVDPSRMDRSGQVINSLVQNLPGTRFALVVFKGDAVISIPVTEDRISLLSYLDFLSMHHLQTQNHNLCF